MREYVRDKLMDLDLRQAERKRRRLEHRRRLPHDAEQYPLPMGTPE